MVRPALRRKGCTSTIRNVEVKMKWFEIGNVDIEGCSVRGNAATPSVCHLPALRFPEG